MESGAASQHAITSWAGRSSLDLAFVHSPLPQFSAPISPEMMQSVAGMYSLCPNDCRVLAVTGWDAWDGAAEFSCQLARWLGTLRQQSVLLVDADFTSPVLHKQLKSSVTPGLAELIGGKKTILDVVRPTADEMLFFLPAGDAAVLGPEGLSAQACSEVLSVLRFFKRLVIHAGPLLESPSAIVITSESDHVVMALDNDIRRPENAETLQHQVATFRRVQSCYDRRRVMKSGIDSLRQKTEERLTNTMDSGIAPQQAITPWRESRGMGLTFVHSPLPEFSTPISPEMMQTVTRMYNLCPNDCRVLAVTGWDASDRAADLSCQMARGLAALSQQSVLLVDADFASSVLHKQLQTPATPGLAGLIAGKKTIQEVVRPTADELLFFLPAGAESILSSGGLSAPACAYLFSVLRFFRRVVIHTGPLLKGASAMVLTAASDAVVLALAAGIRRREEAETLRRQVTTLGGKLLGAVLTERPAAKGKRFHG
jgi:Mrp family chromosome partitioning ATPase